MRNKIKKFNKEKHILSGYAFHFIPLQDQNFSFKTYFNG